MATYPVINKVTGEQKQVSMSIHDWDQWKTDNPDWDRDWSDPSTLPGASADGIGDWREKMGKTHPGWADIMKNKINPQAKAAGNGTVHQKYRY